MRELRKWIWLLFVISLVGWSLHTVLFNWVVPKTAAFTLPRKWNFIPLGQSRNIVNGYLGEPHIKSISPDSSIEEWAGGSKDKMYFLKIVYVSDSLAAAYSIHYQYHNWLLNRNYLIDSGSLR